MTKLLLAIFCLLPLAVLVGCGDPDNCTGDECNDNVDCGDNCGDDDDTATPDEFEATLRSVAPYGWVGDHYVWPLEDNLPDPACEDVGQCDVSLEDVGSFQVAIFGDTFACVPQVQLVTVNDNGSTVNVTSPWEDEGICFLTPEGEYSGMDVRTDIKSFINGYDQGTISIESWDAVITGNYFFHDGEYRLEGTVSDDLSSIEYEAVSATGNEFGGTITLED